MVIGLPHPSKKDCIRLKYPPEEMTLVEIQNAWSASKAMKEKDAMKKIWSPIAVSLHTV